MTRVRTKDLARLFYGLTGLLALTGTVVGGEAHTIGSNRQLFLGPWAEDGRDDYLIERMTGVTMTMNEAIPTGEPLLVADRPWETASGERSTDCGLTGSPGIGLTGRPLVIRDGEVYRMYYTVITTNDIWKARYSRIICYAESRDGIHWAKPELGVCDWKGSRKNNIIFPNDDLQYAFSQAGLSSVFIDPHTTGPSEKYKMTVKLKPVRGLDPKKNPMLGKAYYLAASPDGIRWRLASARPIPTAHGDRGFSCFWDRHKKKYVAYSGLKRFTERVRNRVDPKTGTPMDEITEKIVRRSVSVMFSDDLAHWTKDNREAFAADKIDNAGMAPGVERMDYYDGQAWKYDGVAGAYTALPNVFYHWKKVRMKIGGKEVDSRWPGTLDTQLLTSRDGLTWSRTPRRRPFIRLGPEGSFYSKSLWVSGLPIRVNDELFFYFLGRSVPHDAREGHVPCKTAYGAARLRLDGFVSADADYAGGELVTRPLIFTGEELHLNVDTSAGGVVRVEIQDKDGKPINGFALKNADEINGNYLDAAVSWRDGDDVSKLAGQPVKLRFVMRDTKLYTFQFVDRKK